MAFKTAGQTTHFLVKYDDSIGLPALTVANAVLAICESDFGKLRVHLPLSADFFVAGNKIIVQIINDPLKGPAFGSADQSRQLGQGRNDWLVRINPFAAQDKIITNDKAAFLFVAEVAEILMSYFGWDGGSSQGEALSRVMAEDLHPASTGIFVNLWLNWPRPRPDWISRDEPHMPPVGGLGPKGDEDQIAYGCGMIFIYFLRYQLDYSYHDICTAGGTLLSERYRRLTGANDDPATRVGELLDRHFGRGTINLTSNNPFPLYEGDDRKVYLAVGKPTTHYKALPDIGTAHIKPYFNCPVADYPYSEVGSNVTQTITATTLGIGIPSFKWIINDKKLGLQMAGEIVNSSVDVPDPQNPDQPQHQTELFTFDYQVVNAVDNPPGGSSTLTITSQSFGGAYQLDIQVDVDERAVRTTPVSAHRSLTMTTRMVLYEGTYIEDRERCEKIIQKAIESKLYTLQSSLDLLFTLPDPPPPGYLGEILEAFTHIREELARVDETDRELATTVAHYAATRLGVPAHVFLHSARGSKSSVSM